MVSRHPELNIFLRDAGFSRRVPPPRTLGYCSGNRAVGNTFLAGSRRSTPGGCGAARAIFSRHGQRNSLCWPFCSLSPLQYTAYPCRTKVFFPYGLVSCSPTTSHYSFSHVFSISAARPGSSFVGCGLRWRSPIGGSESFIFPSFRRAGRRPARPRLPSYCWPVPW